MGKVSSEVLLPLLEGWGFGESLYARSREAATCTRVFLASKLPFHVFNAFGGLCLEVRNIPGGF